MALVGGASQGIGRATAELLAARGARLILISRRIEVLETLRASLPNPSAHRSLAVDLERTDEVSLSLSRLILEIGPVSIWVNNSGGPKAGPLMEAGPVEMERAFRGHLLASQTILRSVLPGMRELGYGRIINVLSTSVKVPIPNLGVSNLIRAAMASWAKTLSAEIGPFGITINNVLPGFTKTERLVGLAADAAGRTGKSRGEVEAEWIRSIPARRLAEPAETAEAIAFLASPRAAYINGVSLPVDGGRTVAL
ncbi:MAG: SDR family oxidoreductase [Bdellovibrionales bacterium]